MNFAKIGIISAVALVFLLGCASTMVLPMTSEDREKCGSLVGDPLVECLALQLRAARVEAEQSKNLQQEAALALQRQAKGNGNGAATTPAQPSLTPPATTQPSRPLLPGAPVVTTRPVRFEAPGFSGPEGGCQRGHDLTFRNETRGTRRERHFIVVDREARTCGDGGSALYFVRGYATPMPVVLAGEEVAYQLNGLVMGSHRIKIVWLATNASGAANDPFIPTGERPYTPLVQLPLNPGAVLPVTDMHVPL